MRKTYILTNALDWGDAVSTHCILLKSLGEKRGAEVRLVAQHADPRVGSMRDCSPDWLLKEAKSDDLLVHQMFNETELMDLVEQFPGPRVMMYHNITPPEFFETGDPVAVSCANGLKQVRAASECYSLALGMTEFSRRDLANYGYERTGVFPLLVDLEGLSRRPANRLLLYQNKPADFVLLFVGRVAPNKKIEDLLRLVAECRRQGAHVFLRVVGNLRQHPGYVKRLGDHASELKLVWGRHFEFCGKVPEEDLIAYYRTADAFVTMSEHEGFCAPLVEAMGFDLPVFYFDAGGCREAAGEGGVGFRTKDFSKIASRILSVLGDEEERRDVLRRQASRLKEVSLERQEERVAHLFDELSKIEQTKHPRPRISVVINTLNRERQLARCLSALKCQSYPDFEVVVVNGPSSDGTDLVLERYRSVIKLEKTTLTNISVSRNIGLAACSGELVAFLDDDAVADPRWLEALASAFHCNKVGAAGGLVYRMNGRDVEFRNGVIDRNGLVEWNRTSPGLYWEADAAYANTVSGNNCMFRRKALLEIGGFDEAIEYYHDEADVAVRLCKAGYYTVHKPSAVVFHEAATSVNRRNPYRLNWYAICKNTVYFSLKSEARLLKRISRAVSSISSVMVRRLGAMLVWKLQRKVGWNEFVAMTLHALHGIAVGFVKGLTYRRSVRKLRESPSAARFLRFPSSRVVGPRVCILSQELPWRSPGGIATYTMALATGLRDLGCIVHVVSRGEPRPAECMEDIWFHTACEVRDAMTGDLDKGLSTLRKNLCYSLGVLRAVRDIEARWGIDLVESPNWDFEGLAVALEHRLPLIVRAHSPLFEVAKTQGWTWNEDLRMCAELEGVLMRHASLVTGSTHAILDLIDSRYPIANKCAVVPLGLDIPGCEGRPGVEPAEARVLFVGRLEPRKGIRTLLDAIPIVDAAVPGVRFDIVGRDCGGPEGTSWKEWWENNHASLVKTANVRFHGEVTDVQLAKFYESCSIFVAPSAYESFGLIYVEAMARGKPVVACNIGGVGEVVADGVTGLLAPPNDPSELAARLIRLLKDEELRIRLGEAGRARYFEQFTASRMAQATLEIYQRAIRQWHSEDACIWQATAMELSRTPQSEIEWDEATRVAYVRVPSGSPGIPIFGPYVRIPEGSYRAEFKLCLCGGPMERACIATVEVFSLRTGTLAARPIWAHDFQRPGDVFDVYFASPPGGLDDCEFRIHTSGQVPFRVREITVRKWPHPALEMALKQAGPFSSKALYKEGRR